VWARRLRSENQPTTPNDMPPVSAPQRRPFQPLFTYLYRLVLTRSRAPECPKANHFLAYLALLVGPETLSRPATAQNSLERGHSPPCAPPGAPARRPGGATPSPEAQKKSSAFGGRWRMEGKSSPRHTALKSPQKVPCRNSVRLGWADLPVVVAPYCLTSIWTSRAVASSPQGGVALRLHSRRESMSLCVRAGACVRGRTRHLTCSLLIA
jgi:hypothetical protein